MEKINQLRKYLQEWNENQEYAEANCQDMNFSWEKNDKEKISIQNAVRSVYSEMDESSRDSLSQEDKMLVQHILSCKIDY